MTIEMSQLVWGPGGAPRVLLIHGVTSSAQVWWLVASRLAMLGVEVVAVDLRGHGSSPRTESYRMDDFVADLEAHLSKAPAYDLIVGHSLGGVVTVLSETGGVPLCLLDPPIKTADLVGFSDSILSERQLNLDEVAQQHPGWHPDDVYWKWWSAAAMTQGTVERWVSDCVPWNITSALERLHVPTRLLVADPAAGGLILDSHLEPIEDHPHIMLQRAAGLGHSLQRDDPDLVVGLIAAVADVDPSVGV